MSSTTTRSIVAATATLLLAIAAPVGAEPSVYTLDSAHSEVSFQIRHLVSSVRGYFRDFDVRIVRDDAEPASSSVSFSARVDSIDTDNERRDAHLKTDDFFWMEEHPEITFESTAVERVSDTEYSVTGPLTIRGVSRVVTLPVAFTGDVADPWGNVKAGFSTAITLDRKEFDILWNKTLDSGGLLLGDEVRVEIEIAAKKQG